MSLNMWLIIGLIVLLLALSAFLSGSETALTAASRPRVHKLAAEGHGRARLVATLQSAKAQLISALLLANNLTNILASALATSVMIAAFGDSGVVLATLVMTLLIFVFAELLPKAYAIHDPLRTALRVARPVRCVAAALRWPVSAVDFLTRRLLRLAFFRRASEFEGDEEELLGAIELHARAGADERQERAMMKSILELDDVDVGDVMVHRHHVFMLNAALDGDEVLARAAASPFSRIPLWRGRPDNVVGVLHAKALLAALHDRKRDGGGDARKGGGGGGGGGGGALKPEGAGVMRHAASPWFIPESTSLLSQLQSFRRRREHFALVVDEYGALMGIVTLEDILEEIVGDIADEFDPARRAVTKVNGGHVEVVGDVTIRDLNRRFDWTLPHRHAATVAGLLMHESRILPTRGQVFSFYGFRFKVLETRRHRITRLRLTPQNGQTLPPATAAV